MSKWSGELKSTTLHHRTGSVHATPDDLNRLAAEIRGVGGTALRMTRGIEQWQTHHGDFD
jgi:hypothetical protein